MNTCTMPDSSSAPMANATMTSTRVKPRECFVFIVSVPYRVMRTDRDCVVLVRLRVSASAQVTVMTYRSEASRDTTPRPLGNLGEKFVIALSTFTKLPIHSRASMTACCALLQPPLLDVQLGSPGIVPLVSTLLYLPASAAGLFSRIRSAMSYAMADACER